MPFQAVTLGAATQALAGRLGDPGMVRFVQAELSAYVIEAIRTWSAFSGCFRDQGVFTTVDGQPFYDLMATLPGLLGSTVTDQSLISTIEYSLLEPPTTSVWTGSAQFNLEEIVAALQRRRDQWILETGCVLARSTQGLPPTMGGRQPLAQDVMTVRRVAWQTTDGNVTPLTREDVWSISHFLPNWVQSTGRPPIAVPFGYSVGETPPLVMQIAPPNSDTGLLDIVYVPRGTPLTVGTGSFLGIPNDFTPFVRFGAMADLLSKDGLAADPARAQYCESRWRQGIQVAQAWSTVWAARVNNVAVQIEAMTEADDYDTTWQSRIGQPTTLLSAGCNMVGLSDVPDDVYSVTLDVVRSAPVPVLPGDFLQVGEEVLDGLLGYCVHLAMTKEGFPAVQESQPLLEQFMRLAGVTLAIDSASTSNKNVLTGQSKQDEIHTARIEAS